VPTYGSLIKGYGILRNIKKVEALWAEMVRKKVHYDSFRFYVLWMVYRYVHETIMRKPQALQLGITRELKSWNPSGDSNMAAATQLGCLTMTCVPRSATRISRHPDQRPRRRTAYGATHTWCVGCRRPVTMKTIATVTMASNTSGSAGSGSNVVLNRQSVSVSR
jgi:pentatricopeptide repeat protein